MFYISSVADKERKIGVTDTEDGVEEFYTDSQIAKILKSTDIDIYGTSYYNGKANCTALKLDQTLSVSRLKELLMKWKSLHNQWTGYPVEDYLASSKVGTVISVDYATKSSSGRSMTGTTVIKKLSYDEWVFKDTDNIASGKTGNSRFAAWCLEVSCVYNTYKSILIK